MKEKDHNIASIDKFLADNPEFESLSARLSQFNVFRALKIEKVEIRHSNVLAWLLDPDESHGFSNIVLRRLLSNILLMSEKMIKGFSAARVELLDFSDIEVLREWKNIDILVKDLKNKIILFFENKIYSGESIGQLAKYKRIVENEFPQFKIIPVFLTLTGQESSDKDAQDYISYSHTQLYLILSKLFEQRKSQLAEPVQVFMQHYLDTLRRLTMQDEELTNLCKTIYRKHREAIDLIVEYGIVSTFSQAAEDVLMADGKYEILSSSPSQFWFLPNSWKSLIPENAMVWPHLKRPVSICCWFIYSKGKLYNHFEVCKMDDLVLRLECVKSLKAAGFSLSKKAFDKNATYSRFYGKNVKINDETDYDEMSSAIEKLLGKSKEEFPKVETVLKEVFKDINVKK
ncbi:MAG: PD-(D/E)XK nuclease family protein [Planctomycetes bacterium]|nr:PD-(D/E)XK nuclease family protein [Planctomycetota bacterium]MBL7144622.1 PD-(D/E)XK nuclease family protein [Phycisphaerae bacterium]